MIPGQSLTRDVAGRFLGFFFFMIFLATFSWFGLLHRTLLVIFFDQWIQSSMLTLMTAVEKSLELMGHCFCNVPSFRTINDKVIELNLFPDLLKFSALKEDFFGLVQVCFHCLCMYLIQTWCLPIHQFLDGFNFLILSLLSFHS